MADNDDLEQSATTVSTPLTLSKQMEYTSILDESAPLETGDADDVHNMRLPITRECLFFCLNISLLFTFPKTSCFKKILLVTTPPKNFWVLTLNSNQLNFIINSTLNNILFQCAFLNIKKTKKKTKIYNRLISHKIKLFHF